jgi:hypothetical protein
MSSLTSHRCSLGFLAITLLTFLAASSAPTPLYHLYQEGLHFSAGMLTPDLRRLRFESAGAVDRRLAVGPPGAQAGDLPRWSSRCWRCCCLSCRQRGLADRCAPVQGFATGMATAVLGAALLDTDRQQGPLINSVAPLLGMACGAMGCSLLVEFAPFPTTLIYWTL